ncbi:MAG TPA: hypothetical protein VF070_34435 [Streptosporangiaceae bacterium]
MTNQMPTSQAEDVFRLVNALYQEHGDALTEAEAVAVRGLRDRMTDILCPYPVAVLEEDRKKLDAKFPDREHWYVRCGKTVTWCDRRKLSSAAPPPRLRDPAPPSPRHHPPGRLRTPGWVGWGHPWPPGQAFLWAPAEGRKRRSRVDAPQPFLVNF